MADKDGLDVQRELQGHGVPRPIVFLSGQARVPDSVTATKAGAVDFLTKPLDGDQLVAIERAMKLDHSERLARRRF